MGSFSTMKCCSVEDSIIHPQEKKLHSLESLLNKAFLNSQRKESEKSFITGILVNTGITSRARFRKELKQLLTKKTMFENY